MMHLLRRPTQPPPLLPVPYLPREKHKHIPWPLCGVNLERGGHGLLQVVAAGLLQVMHAHRVQLPLHRHQGRLQHRRPRGLSLADLLGGGLEEIRQGARLEGGGGQHQPQLGPPALHLKGTQGRRKWEKGRSTGRGVENKECAFVQPERQTD